MILRSNEKLKLGEPLCLRDFVAKKMGDQRRYGFHLSAREEIRTIGLWDYRSLKNRITLPAISQHAP